MNKFKVGDRVKVNWSCANKGQPGVITKIDGIGTKYVTLDKGTNTTAADDSSLILIETTKSKGNTMKLSKVQKQNMKPNDVTILEAFYTDKGTLATNSEEFGAWFLTKFGGDAELLRLGREMLADDKKE